MEGGLSFLWLIVGQLNYFKCYWVFRDCYHEQFSELYVHIYILTVFIYGLTEIKVVFEVL